MHTSEKENSYQNVNNETFNSVCWQRQLKQLYLLIYEHVSEIAQSCRVSGSACLKEGLPYEFEILAARVCSQIFGDYEQTTSLDITQIAMTQTQPQTSMYHSSSKKRRVEIGFSSVADKLREEGTSEGTIPWYRILCRMLKDYSEYFTSFERSERLLDLFTHVLPQCKSGLVIEEILNCLKELSKPNVFSISDTRVESNKRKWTKVAELTIRLITGKQSSSVGMQLLCSLIMNHLVYPQASLYKMYLRSVFPLNEDGLKLLQALLINYPLPKIIKTEDYIYLEEDVTDSRNCILNMMFPLDHELENKNESTIQFPANHPFEVSNVVALLSLKNPLKTKIQNPEISDGVSVNSLQESSIRRQENSCEKLINSTEFILDFSDCKLRNADINVMDRIFLFIRERVVNEEELHKDKVLLTLNIIEMLIHLWPHFPEERRLTEGIPNTNVIKKYIEKILLPSSESSCPWNEVLLIIEKLNHVLLLAKTVCLKHNCGRNLQNLVEAFSSDFQNLLLQAAKIREKSIPSHSSFCVTQLSRNNTSQADFDPDFDDMESQEEENFVLKDVFEDDCDDAEEEAAEHCKDLSIGSLSQKDKALLSIIECLGKLYELTLIMDPSSDDENLPFIECIKTAGELAKSEKNRDHIIVLELVNMLFTMQYSEDNIEDGLKMLSNISGHNSKNAKLISSALMKLKELLILNGKHLVDEHKQNVIHLLKVYSEKYLNGFYGLNVSERIYENVLSLVKLDPLRAWSIYKVSDNDDRMCQVYSLLRSPFHDLRMKVVDNIQLLFMTEKNDPLPLQHQKKNFEQLYQIAIESLTVEGSLSEEYITDEGRCRVNSFLFSLVAVVKSSSALEPQALYAIISAAKVNNINIDCIKCALNSISLPPDLTLNSYLESHFKYLISQWTKDKHPLEDFPYQIFDAKDHDSFIQRYVNQIAASLFVLDDGINEIEKFVQISHTDVKTLLVNNFSLLMANLMPYLVASLSNLPNKINLSKIKISSATRKWKYLEQALGHETLVTHIRDDIGEVVLNLLRITHDENSWNNGEVVVPPTNNYFDNEVSLVTLNYAHNLFFKDQDPVLSLLCDRKSSIHSVLHGLFSDVAKSLSLKSRRLRLALSPFASFLRLIIPSIGSQLKDMEHFLIRKLVYILTNFIVDFSTDYGHLAGKCCDLLHDLILACLNYPSSSSILNSTLPFVITSLHSLNNVASVWNSVYNVLLSIFNSDCMPVKLMLANMAPFPVDRDDENLRNLHELHQSLKNSHQRNLCLRKNIENFIKIPIDDVTTYDIENIVQLLVEKKSEICELYSSVLPNGINVAHSLIYNLVTIVSNTTDFKKGSLGLEVIGKLGPVTLGTSVFLVPQEPNEYFQKSGELGTVAEILISLNRLTFARSLPVVDSSIVALRRILSMKEVFVILTTDLKATDLISDLLPFLPARKPKSRAREYQDLSLVEFEKKIGDKCLWMPESTFDSWVVNLTVGLIESGCGSDFFNHLIPVCRLNVNFCKQILPYIFLNVLKVDAPRRRQSVSRRVSYMLETMSEDKTSERFTHQRSANRSHVAKSCLRTMINVINFLRTKKPAFSFSNRKNITCWDRNLWLDIDYFVAAKAAFICGSLYSAVLFAELACDIILEASSTNDNNNSNMSNQTQNRQLPPLQRISQSRKCEEISNLLLKVSNELCDSEGVEGCGGLSSVTDGIVQSTLSLHRGFNAQALYISDANDEDNCLVSSLQSVGMYGILHKMTMSSTVSDELSLEAKAECAWRLGQWEELNETKNKGFNQCLLNGFKAFKERDLTLFQDSKKDYYQHVLSSLKEGGIESTSSIYPLLGNLQMLSELADLFKCISVQTDEERLTFITSLESCWDEKENFGQMEKATKERILSSRISSVRILTSNFTEDKSIFDNILFRLLIKKCELGTIRDRFRAIKEAGKINLTSERRWALKLEEVKLALSLDNKSQAICSLENILQDITANKSEGREKLKSHYETLVFCGKVLTDSRTRSPKHVIENYYGKAIAMIEHKTENNCCEILEDCYHNLASFGDSLYQEVNETLSSDHSQNKIKYIESGKQEIEQLESLINLTQQKAPKRLSSKDQQDNKQLDLQKRLLERDINREVNEIMIQKNESEEFLNLSLENYLKVLTCSSKYNLNIFRVIALWLENLTSGRVNNLVLNYCSKIKTYKFIPLLYQLVARLTCINDPKKQHKEFNKILSFILEKVCTDHPHHGLPVVLMLAHSHLDEGQDNITTEEDRVKAAKNLVARMKKTKLLPHISELENVSLAYITLANRPDKNSLTMMTKSNSLLMKLRNLDYTAPLTRAIPVNESAVYSPPLISNWDPSITLPGGINLPQKLTIFSSDGRKSYELLKGNDDLRQDVVIEQVFSVVNELLRKDQEANKLNLSVNTYLVCPLSQKTGLIQWCDNTMTFGDCIIDSHKLYYPNDPTPLKCREKMRNATIAAKANGENSEIVLSEALEEILARFHPVFRFFFYDQYPQPEKWFTQRRSYTRSVATSSIAGYILGIGDRHMQNLLLDTTKAEVIHIDLGIAFEKGKLLPTPEKVPFRMTQNIIDGFGAMGIEGPLRKNMETTMRVLRDSKSVLITIVEVLRHDPLHHWTLSPTQLAKFQKEESEAASFIEETNSASMAERALIRVQQKLNGLHNGLVVSVPEHVSILLQQATDVKNLSGMFFGWQPYL